MLLTSRQFLVASRNPPPRQLTAKAKTLAKENEKNYWKHDTVVRCHPAGRGWLAAALPLSLSLPLARAACVPCEWFVVIPLLTHSTKQQKLVVCRNRYEYTRKTWRIVSIVVVGGHRHWWSSALVVIVVGGGRRGRCLAAAASRRRVRVRTTAKEAAQVRRGDVGVIRPASGTRRSRSRHTHGRADEQPSVGGYVGQGRSPIGTGTGAHTTCVLRLPRWLLLTTSCPRALARDAQSLHPVDRPGARGAREEHRETLIYCQNSLCLRTWDSWRGSWRGRHGDCRMAQQLCVRVAPGRT